MAFCPNCGNEVNDDSKFCASCGCPLDHQNQQLQQTQQVVEQSAMEYANTKEKSNPSQNRNQQPFFNSQQVNIGAIVDGVTNTPDTTEQFDPADIEANKGMSILSYISWLVIIPLICGKKSRYLRFHMNQGLVLAILESVWGIVFGVLKSIMFDISFFLGLIFSIFGLVNLVFVAYMVFGIVNAANGKAKELPFIGKVQLLK